ncbi:MAG: HAMP domain-containing histidine kinase [bacterium]|nr:HAMP domain-containing histidine kinase [bacterium]
MKSLSWINNLINFDFSTSQNVVEGFKLVQKTLGFEHFYLFFVNPDDLELKYSDTSFTNLKISIDGDLKSEIFSTNHLAKLPADIEKEMNLEGETYIVEKLSLNGTIFGVLVFTFSKEVSYDEKFGVFASIISYKIKDKELSEVFSQQLKAIQDGFVNTRNAYKTIKEQNEKILKLDKIKNEFLANVTHDLRTPLNSIIGFSEMLSTKLFGDLNEKQSEYVNEIYVAGVHLLGMINEILDISKIESCAMKLNKNQFFISRAVDEVLNVVNPLVNKKNIKLEKNVTPDDFEVVADFQKIKQILYNLVSNAIKFTKEQGNITVSVKKNKSKFVISVQDDGIGIPKEAQEKIFEKFFQVESTYLKSESSTGLGLTITKEFAVMHGGNIKVESELNKGAKFVVTMPLS